MHREINPPDEILRRLIYLVYLTLLVSTAVLGVLAFVQSRTDYLTLCLILCFASMQLRQYGNRHFDFKRLFKSFPYGEQGDSISPTLREEIEGIIMEFETEDLNWVQRQELRQRLTELIEKDLRIFELFREEITSIHPALAAKTKLLLYNNQA